MKNLTHHLLLIILTTLSCADASYDTPSTNTFTEKSNTTTIFKLTTNIQCQNPCQFEIEHNLNDISKIEYFAESWKLGSSFNPHNNFAISYHFNTLGRRLITAIAYNHNSQEISRYSNWIQITNHSTNHSTSPNLQNTNSIQIDVPYFYQYDNLYYPNSTCQNTSIAMVLKYYNWSGIPDHITSTYGKNYTQSPAGLADVFNTLSRHHSLNVTLTPNTNGTLSQLKQQLDKGLPIIIHGYFTRSGHVVVITGYDQHGYWVNDPAGVWSQTFMGGYTSNPNGKSTYYKRQPFEDAISSNGHSFLPLWFHTPTPN